MKKTRFAVVQVTENGRLAALQILDRVAGKISNIVQVSAQALQDGSAKAKLTELLGTAAYLNLRAA